MLPWYSVHLQLFRHNNHIICGTNTNINQPSSNHKNNAKYNNCHSSHTTEKKCSTMGTCTLNSNSKITNLHHISVTQSLTNTLVSSKRSAPTVIIDTHIVYSCRILRATMENTVGRNKDSCISSRSSLVRDYG
jgi:hypothetical protein